MAIPKVQRFASFILVCACAFGISAGLARAQKVVLTVAGGGGVGNGGPATSAALARPQYGAYDKNGNLYVTEISGHRVRKITLGGIIKTIAGNGISGYSGDGGPAKSAKVSFPRGLVTDGKGNIYFSDSGNQRVRKIDTNGIITTVAGNGIAGYSGDGGPATSASLNWPFGLALHGGNLYIADWINNVVRKVDTSGIITTVAGNGTPGYSGDGGPATEAELGLPQAAALDANGNLYIADTSNLVVRKVDNTGIITTFAGNAQGGCTGDGGPATAASIGPPLGLTVKAGNLLLTTNSCGRVRVVDLGTNIINTSAGSEIGFNGDGNAPLLTEFQLVRGLGFDPSGDLMVLDTGNNRVRSIRNGKVTTIAGGYIGDGGPATAASLNSPEAMAFDAAGGLYIADSRNFRIRKVDASGNISTFAGTGFSGYSGDGGPAGLATLFWPTAVTVDSSGNVFIADQGGDALRKVDVAGTIATLPNPNSASMTSLAADSSGNLYASDRLNCIVWKITPDDLATIIAGVQDQCGFNGDGIPATQAWLNPQGVGVDSKGNVFIADAFNNRIRKVNTSGIINTIAGNGTCGFSGDGGPAKKAMLCWPYAVATSGGKIYIADTYNERIRWVDTFGTIRTLAGNGGFGYNGDSLPAKKTNVDSPVGILIAPGGVIYYVDDIQSRVRKIQ